MDYYSLFWGPRVFSTIDDPRGSFMCPSSTLTILADSEPFNGLLLTVLGPQTDFVVVEPQGALTCRSSTLIVFADSGTFHVLLLTVLGSRSNFHD